MPAFAPITINDGATTPLARTFNPRHEYPDGVWVLANSSAVAAIGDNTLKMSLKFPNGGIAAGADSSAQRVIRSQLTLALPVLESTSAATGSGIPPAPTIAYVLRANVEFILPERAQIQERKDLNALLKNALAHTTWTDYVVNLQATY